MKQLESALELKTLVQQEPVVMLLFGSETCGPCHAIRQRIKEWNSGYPQVQSRYVPVETFRLLAASWDVFSTPSLIVVVQEKVTVRQSGFFSLDQILSQTERILHLMEK